IKAVEAALHHPLIEPSNIRSATHGLICMMGGEDEENSMMIRFRVLDRLHRELDSYCDIKPGYVQIPGMEGIRILLILSGMELAPANGNEVGSSIRISPKEARDGFKLVETSYGQSAPTKVAADTSPTPVAESPAESAPQPGFRSLLDQTLATVTEPTYDPTMGEPVVPKRSEPQPNGTRIRGPMGVIGSIIMKTANSAQPVEFLTPPVPQDENEELTRLNLQDEKNIAEAMNIPSMPYFLNKNAS
ncbi:MAG: hypothetical protein ORO03_05250, partial [Alphaproteobacteria bacterium]|nr:hypothetical protein [Alphaproteobacteria bacterium]